MTERSHIIDGAVISAIDPLMVSAAAQTAASVDVNDGISADVDAAVAAATGLRLVGFACRESAGTAAVATFRILHGATAAAGTTIFPVELAASGSAQHWFWPGIAVPNGISIDVIAGTVDVELFTMVVTA